MTAAPLWRLPAVERRQTVEAFVGRPVVLRWSRLRDERGDYAREFLGRLVAVADCHLGGNTELAIVDRFGDAGVYAVSLATILDVKAIGQ